MPSFIQERSEECEESGWSAPLVKRRHVTEFSRSEEEAIHLTTIVPFQVEDELKRLGALYLKGPDWLSFIQIDCDPITGQNRASSSEATHEELLVLAGIKSRKKSR